MPSVSSSEVRAVGRGEAPDRFAILGGNRQAWRLVYLEAQRHSVPFVDFPFGAKPVSSEKATNRVHCGTLQKLKGLEYKHVYLVGLDAIEAGDAVTDDALLRRLIYVCMTRSTHNLTVVPHDEGEMVTELNEVARVLA